uniref:AN1-type domain-containing protein n=2 Tax=Macrostomum lignano TaxID=282301 RepID=A0A1I8J636_9PLAT
TPTAEESQASPQQQQQQQQQLPLPLSIPTPQSIAAMLAVPTDDGSASSRGAFCDASSGSGSGSVVGGSSELKRRNRCHACKKRVGLTGFECRCGGTYCPAHRYSDKHDCSFDYRSHGRHEIRKANPQVLSSKVDRL